MEIENCAKTWRVLGAGRKIAHPVGTPLNPPESQFQNQNTLSFPIFHSGEQTRFLMLS